MELQKQGLSWLTIWNQCVSRRWRLVIASTHPCLVMSSLAMTFPPWLSDSIHDSPIVGGYMPYFKPYMFGFPHGSMILPSAYWRSRRSRCNDESTGRAAKHRRLWGGSKELCLAREKIRELTEISGECLKLFLIFPHQLRWGFLDLMSALLLSRKSLLPSAGPQVQALDQSLSRRTSTRKNFQRYTR